MNSLYAEAIRRWRRWRTGQSATGCASVLR